MSKKEEILQVFGEVKLYGQKLLEELENGTDMDSFVQKAVSLPMLIAPIGSIIPSQVYEGYREFFETFSRFCKQCGNAGFLEKYTDEMASSLALFVECMENLEGAIANKIKKCACCGQKVMYLPMPEYFIVMKEKYHFDEGVPELINKEEYLCPHCFTADRDRMIVSFLEKENLRDAAKGAKALQIAPAHAISWWIMNHCPQIEYETTDLFMEGVTFRSDIQDMNMIADEAYDVIICSNVLEHVQDDRKALRELKRILKPDGKVVFLVPVVLDRDEIDEEWGLPEEENWRRFGQGDHCRLYGKAGLMERLQEQFYVHSLGKEYFGETIFEQCGLVDTSILYILTKEERVPLSMAENFETGKKCALQ